MRASIVFTAFALAAAPTLSAQTAAAIPANAVAVETPAVEVTGIPRSQRPRVFVQAFEFNATLSDQDRAELNSLGSIVAAMRGGDPMAAQRQSSENLGRAAADMLVEQLLESGFFRVVERRALDVVKAEQDLVSSDRAAANQSVAQQAKLLGAKYMVTGAITKFGRSQEKKGGFGGIAGAVLKAKTGIAVGAITSGKTTYQIEITARIVDTETGEVVASMTSDGTAVGNKSRTIAGGGVLGAVIGGAVSKSTTGERESKIAEALAMSTAGIGEKLVVAQKRGDIEP